MLAPPDPPLTFRLSVARVAFGRPERRIQSPVSRRLFPFESDPSSTYPGPTVWLPVRSVPGNELPFITVRTKPNDVHGRLGPIVRPTVRLELAVVPGVSAASTSC